MRRLILQQHQKNRFLLFIGDLLIIIGGLSLILFLEAEGNKIFSWEVSKIVTIYIIIIVITTSIFYILDLYDTARPKGSTNTLLSICMGLGIVIILYSALSYFVILLRPGKFHLILFKFLFHIFRYSKQTPKQWHFFLPCPIIPVPMWQGGQIRPRL